MVPSLDSVPSAAWVVVGSIITLIGVLLTNRGQDRRFKAQLDHDLEVKDRERQMSWRKEVFLSAAEAIAGSFLAIGKFSNLELPAEKLMEDYSGKAHWLTKINLIGQDPTITAVGNFSRELSGSFLRLLVKRASLVGQSQKITILRSRVDNVLKEQGRTLELMKQYNLEGIRDQEKWGILERRSNFESSQYEEASTKASELTTKLIAGQAEYLNECLQEMSKLSRLLVPVMVAVRKEMELPTDEDQYRKTLEESIEQIANTLKQFSQEMQSLFSSWQRDEKD